MRSRAVLLVLGLAWVVTVGTGISLLNRYQAVPGEAGCPAATWPSGSGFSPTGDRAQLLLFAHPRCPCTRASLSELARLMARVPDTIRAEVLFVRPAGAAADWEQTDLWRTAAAIPGVSVRVDDGGTEARRFGASTSGQVLLYDAAGRLRFSGGITPARGHEGDNAGSAAILAALASDGLKQAEAAVFGCPLGETCPACNPPGQPCTTE